MSHQSLILRLTDIVEAIDLINAEMAGVSISSIMTLLRSRVCAGQSSWRDDRLAALVAHKKGQPQSDE